MISTRLKKVAATTMLAGAALGAVGTAAAAPASAAGSTQFQVCTTANYSITVQLPQAFGGENFNIARGYQCRTFSVGSEVTYVKVWGINKSYYVGTGHKVASSINYIIAEQSGSSKWVHSYGPQGE